MDMLKHLNAAVDYIESNLLGEIDMDALSRTACLSNGSFTRFFSYMVGMTLKEYIRRRRLTLAALELQGSDSKVIDTAVKYGWDSPDAFTKAFIRQHGITPTEARDPSGTIKIYPPASFYIMIKGAKEMDFRIIELADTAVYGVSELFEGKGYQSREELRHLMWSEKENDVPGQICEGRWNESSSSTYDGAWYGIWRDGKYMIAREEGNVKGKELEKFIIPSGTYAAFRTGRGGLAWEELPKLRDLIFDSWLPNSEYRHKGDMMIEVLHLWADHDLRNKNRFYEWWIPVEKA